MSKNFAFFARFVSLWGKEEKRQKEKEEIFVDKIAVALKRQKGLVETTCYKKERRNLLHQQTTSLLSPQLRMKFVMDKDW